MNVNTFKNKDPVYNRYLLPVNLNATLLQSLRFIGRRIEFDYEKFGHSPSCLGSNTNIVNGKEAVVQGYGRAEDGKTDRHILIIA